MESHRNGPQLSSRHDDDDDDDGYLPGEWRRDVSRIAPPLAPSFR